MWNAYHPDRPVTIVAMPADWARYKNRAGPIRNTEMVIYVETHPDPDKRVAVFAGGTGTADCARKARNARFALVETRRGSNND